MRLTVCLFVIALSACATKRIPGTQIADTDDTRAILAVMRAYADALGNKDAEKMLSLVAPDYMDDGGTGTPVDDLNYAALQRELPGRLAKMEDVKADIVVKTVDVSHDEAMAVYQYNLQFRLPAYTSRQQTESDLQKMLFRRVDGEWKIVSGL